jgi:hypothetical protein
VLLHPHRPSAAQRPYLTEAAVELDAAGPAAAVASHDDHHLIADCARLHELQPQVVEGAEPVLHVAPHMLVAAIVARYRAVLERPPLEVGVHAREHRFDVTPVQGVDDLAHELHAARLHLWAKYGPARACTKMERHRPR